MKQTPRYSKAQELMKPGKITADGFLGDETITIADIINRDECEMRALDLEFEAVANTIKFLMKEGEKGLGEPIKVEGRWIVQVFEAKGSLPCPFEHPGLYKKTAAEITCLITGKKLLVTELSLHLFKEHHFMQGKGSPFRLEPHDLNVIFCK